MTTSGGAPVSAPQSWPWVGVDPRGYVVILSKGRWEYGAKHYGEFGDPSLGLAPDPFKIVTRALTQPDAILDNSSRRGAPPRIGAERYYRQDPYCDPPHVIVVVTILEADTLIDSYAAKAGSRLAYTFYVAPTAPVGTQLWP